jgi:hypothetical protein
MSLGYESVADPLGTCFGVNWVAGEKGLASPAIIHSAELSTPQKSSATLRISRSSTHFASKSANHRVSHPLGGSLCDRAVSILGFQVRSRMCGK